MYAVLRFIAGAELGETVPVKQGTVLTLGRSSTADRKVRDNHLSRIHVAFDFTGGDCTVVDMKSRNGVFVNGERIQRKVVKAGDRVQVGEQVLEVSFVEQLAGIEGEAEETQSFLDSLHHCEHCGRPITLATFADGDVKEKGGSYLCPDCATILDVGTDEFMGFKILEKLGVGSTGLVFRAQQMFLSRVVALKVLRARDDLSEKAIVRFLREAATISRMDHPNIVKVYDAQEFPKGYFIVMEYFPGKDLLSLVEQHGPPSIAIATSIGLQMCQALAYAANANVVHRDIKPANILYRASDGLAKLSDFGLAKRMGPSSWNGITRDGEGLGTPCYMPPEQVRDARHVDPRADIYALGASLYHVLTGRYPVVAKSYAEFIQQILERDPPPVETINPRVPPALAEVVRIAMKKDATQRYQSAQELGAALEQVRRKLGLPAPPGME
ncbi:MAG TPA: FHA domain-containing serine/threonine-protein kinase [Planctomycetota bacterium]|nr:FHA domain-containing serine/threonine-protein kinase [Planctomycetota bacterium]